MGDIKTGQAQIGTQAAPVILGATGGATDVGTYTHGEGQKAIAVQLFDDVNGAPILAASIVVTQPDANTIVLTNTTAGILNAVAIVTWELPTPGKALQVAAADVVLT